MTTVPFILRDLPGVRELEAMIHRIEAHPNPEWSPEVDQLQPIVDRLSMRLFGVTEAQTTFDQQTIEKHEPRWEQHFDLLRYDGGSKGREANAVWSLMGWDVTAETGEEMLAVIYLGRQIIVATKGLMGRLPDAPKSEIEINDDAETWASQMEREAAKFQNRRRV